MIPIETLQIFGAGCAAGVIGSAIVFALMGIAYGEGAESREDDE